VPAEAPEPGALLRGGSLYTDGAGRLRETSCSAGGTAG